MGVEDHKSHALTTVNCAVLTVSNTRAIENDDSGRQIRSFLEENEHRVEYYRLVRDDIGLIRAELEKLINTNEFAKVQAIIINGGTGISPYDVTIEALSPYMRKVLMGFGELFRHLSYNEIGTAAVMSRAIAGTTANNKIIIALPGSVNAIKLAMAGLVLPELGHMVWEASKGQNLGDNK
ncbi:MAG: molybdenum cofactor biosynthesis protein MoaB [Thermoplasmata archaeon]|nr:molybdenum cofactor biosynthesis protein MoaB [Thermoplasmata archaeon]